MRKQSKYATAEFRNGTHNKVSLKFREREEEINLQ
jgi:hypothetical protein